MGAKSICYIPDLNIGLIGFGQPHSVNLEEVKLGQIAVVDHTVQLTNHFTNGGSLASACIKGQETLRATFF